VAAPAKRQPRRTACPNPTRPIGKPAHQAAWPPRAPAHAPARWEQAVPATTPGALAVRPDHRRGPQGSEGVGGGRAGQDRVPGHKQLIRRPLGSQVAARVAAARRAAGPRARSAHATPAGGAAGAAAPAAAPARLPRRRPAGRPPRRGGGSYQAGHARPIAPLAECGARARRNLRNERPMATPDPADRRRGAPLRLVRLPAAPPGSRGKGARLGQQPGPGAAEKGG